MTNLRRALLASLAVAVAVPAFPAPASAEPIISCSPTFLIGPVRCELSEHESQVREDHPVVDEVLTAIWPG